VVKNVLETDGDLAMVQSKKNSNSGFWKYASHLTYTATGAVSSMQLGNGRWESVQFNSRLQPVQIALGNVSQATNLLKLNFDYGTTQNNGNVLSQTITVPTVGQNQGFTAVQTYSYDSLNRLKSATETISGNQTWKQTFVYDRYGNRRFDETETTTIAGCERAVCNPMVNPLNNRFMDGQGYEYDEAGNLTRDAQGRRFIYDGENKQVEVKDASNGVVGRYYYDGEGRRVKKEVPGTGETTIFVYDAFGRLIAEYSTVVAPLSEAKVSYLTSDHLGSPRVLTEQSGKVYSRRDFMPFGEEIRTPQRTEQLGYGGDAVRQKFTGYERDSESGLDFAQARMFAYRHGRFTSPDPALSSGKETLPQSWNRYVYALNNPLRFTDPLGLYEFDSSVDPTQRDNFRKQLKEANDRLKQIKKIYGENSDEYKQAKAAIDSYGCEAGTEGCSEKAGSSQVIIKAEKLDSGVEATAARDSTGKKVVVTFDATKLSKGADLVAEIAHEGVHVRDHLNYINSGGKIKVSDYDTEFRAFLVTSVMDEAYPSSSSSRMMGGVSYTIYDKRWKTANPKLSAVENVRNKRKAAIDKLLAVPKSEGGAYELTPTKPGNSYFP
jgi:RHS repeat-associated protein